MQAVILAAGKSTRTEPLTLTKPKPLLPIMNRPLLAHALDSMLGIADEVILIVGYMAEDIKKAFGNQYRNLPLRYVMQETPEGTAHSILLAEPFLKERFFAINGDDLYAKEDIEACVRHRYCILTREVSDPRRFSAVTVDGDIVKEIVEKPEHPKTNLASLGIYVLDRGIIPIIKKMGKSERGEYELPTAMGILCKMETMHHVRMKGYWLPTGYAWDLLATNEFFMKNLKSKIDGKLEENAVIRGSVQVGKGTVVKSGTCIEGPVLIGENCVIGPNAYIRENTVIGNNCKIGQAVELKSTVVMNDTKIPHLTYIGDSVIGERVNIGAGTIVANLRHDNANVQSCVKGKMVDTGRRKFGTVIADDAKLGIGTVIYPGRKVWPGKTTLPGEIVKEDII